MMSKGKFIYIYIYCIKTIPIIQLELKGLMKEKSFKKNFQKSNRKLKKIQMFVDFVDKFRIILRHFFYRFGVILKVLFQGKDHWQIIFFILCSCWKINTIIFLVIKFKRPSTKFFYFMFLLEDYWNMINDQILMTTIQICENFILQMTSFGCCYGF